MIQHFPAAAHDDCTSCRGPGRLCDGKVFLACADWCQEKDSESMRQEMSVTIDVYKVRSHLKAFPRCTLPTEEVRNLYG